MGKMTLYILVFSGLMLLFHFGGLLNECDGDGLCVGKTPNSILLNVLLNVQDVNDSSFWSQVIFYLQIVVGVVSIAVGFFSSSLDLAVKAPLALYLANLFVDFVTVFNVVYSTVPAIAVLFIAPILITYLFTIAEWLSGHD